MKKIFFSLTFFATSLIVYSQETSANVVKLKSSEVKDFKFSAQPTKVVIIDNNDIERRNGNSSSLQKQSGHSSNKAKKNNQVFYSPSVTRIGTKK